MTDTAPADQGAETAAEAGPARRGGRSARDMAVSLIVLLIPLAFIVLIFRARGGEDVVVVDPAPAIAQAQRAATFPVAVPTGLAPTWRTISADYASVGRAGTLRLGYLTPGGGGIQLIQSSEPVDPLLIRELGDNVRPIGTAAVGAGRWDSFVARDGDNALVQRGAGRTMIIIGQAPLADLTTLAGALN